MSTDPDHDSARTASHYARGDLLEKIVQGLAKIGKSPDTATTEDLGPVDEFHIGGRLATQHLLEALQLTSDSKVLDIGCGIGGTARLIASQSGAQVKGIDLTPEYIAVGNTLNEWVGLSDRITLSQANALDLPVAAGSFTAATMLHVGMNISDKRALFAEVFRALEPGAVFGLYDIMKLSDEAIDFPMPWAGERATSFVESAEIYQQALQAAGFRVEKTENRSQFAREFLSKLRAMMASVNWPPPLGLHLIMGPEAGAKLGNMSGAVFAGSIAPVLIIASKPG